MRFVGQKVTGQGHQTVRCSEMCMTSRAKNEKQGDVTNDMFWHHFDSSRQWHTYRDKQVDRLTDKHNDWQWQKMTEYQGWKTWDSWKSLKFFEFKYFRRPHRGQSPCRGGGALHRWPERFLKSGGEEPTKSWPNVRADCCTLPVLFCWFRLHSRLRLYSCLFTAL